MIKIRLHNVDKGRNKRAYAMFLDNVRAFSAIGIQFVNYGNADFTFIGPEDFANRKLSLQDSVNWGLDNVQKLQGQNKSIIDSGDSTSLMGSVEILINSPSIRYLFKNQLLNSVDLYNVPTPHGKWWWNDGSRNTDYFIPAAIESVWDRIKLSGWNLGYHSPLYGIFEELSLEREYDICAIYQTKHNENFDFQIRNDLHYTEHRESALNFLSAKYNTVLGKWQYEDYIDKLKKSKLGISPFGMGEICFRDFEYMKYGVSMIKPNMDLIDTTPNPYIKDVTYISCNTNFSDINDKIEFAFKNNLNLTANHQFRNEFRKQYTVGNLIKHWHTFFLTQEGITTNL